VRLTITGSLDHVRPRLQPGLVRVLLALDRTLRRAAREPGMTTLPVLAT
jgi:hypothetical protein